MLDVVELTVESIGVLIAVNPTLTIIAIAAATPPRIPNFLLYEKLNVKLFFKFGLLRVDYGCNLILVSGCLRDTDLSSGWFFRCIVINDSTKFLSSVVMKLSCLTVSLISLSFFTSP